MKKDKYKELEERIAALEKIVKEQQSVINVIRSKEIKNNEQIVHNSREYYSNGGTMLL